MTTISLDPTIARPAIITRLLPPKGKRFARIIARSNGHSLEIAFPHDAPTPTEAHRRAAQALLVVMDIPDSVLVAGQCTQVADGFVFIAVSEAPTT